jgi:CMP-N-acetylneuraminic acid synthetase
LTKGDLFISLRHLSTVLLYRSSSQKIIWLNQGPWLFQHDIDIVDEKTKAVFNNNLLRTACGDFCESGYNSILFFNFHNGIISSPYDSNFGENKINTLSEGRYDLLPSGEVYIDYANNGKVYIFSKQKLKWLYLSQY